MDYNLSIISRDQIPNNIYLCGKNDKDEWQKINYFEFENGLKCVIGASRYLSGKDAVESMKNELDYVLENDSPDALQKYFYENFENFISYSDCQKIFNYYTDNEELIKEAYYTYFDKEESSDDESENNFNENDKEHIQKYIEKYTEKYVKKAFENVCKITFGLVLNKVHKVHKKIN